MITTEEYRREAKRIIILLKKEFTFPDGSLFLEKNGQKIFKHHIYPDLGDIIPFLLYFGEIDFVEKQIESYLSMSTDGLYISEFPTFGLNNLAKTYEYTDLILGLSDYDSFVHSKSSSYLLKSTVDSAYRIFDLGSALSSFYYAPLSQKLPIIDTRDGTFIELLIDLYKKTGDTKHLDAAKNIFEILRGLSFYTEYGLLPDFVVTGPLKYFSFFIKNKTTTVTTCKNNTNTLFGLFALYKVTKRPDVMAMIHRLLDSIKNNLLWHGGVVKDWHVHAIPSNSCLTASFPLIDFLCDLFFYTHDQKILDFAKAIADFWIGYQGKTGLFPLYTDGRESFLDSETDMTIALQKLAEVSGDKKYQQVAEATYVGIIKYHARKDYVLGVDINTGEIMNPTQRTKFIALFLKLLILKIRLKEGVTIYSDPALWSILRDR